MKPNRICRDGLRAIIPIAVSLAFVTTAVAGESEDGGGSSAKSGAGAPATSSSSGGSTQGRNSESESGDSGGGTSNSMSAGGANGAAGQDRRGPQGAGSSGGCGLFGGVFGEAFGQGSGCGAPPREALQTEQKTARDGVAGGQIRPFEEVLHAVESAVPGAVLSARLKKDGGGRLIYSVVVLTDSGRYRHVTVNAATAQIILVQ